MDETALIVTALFVLNINKNGPGAEMKPLHPGRLKGTSQSCLLVAELPLDLTKIGETRPTGHLLEKSYVQNLIKRTHLIKRTNLMEKKNQLEEPTYPKEQTTSYDFQGCIHTEPYRKG